MTDEKPVLIDTQALMEDIKGLTLEERGLYWLLLNHYLMQGQPLSLEPEALADYGIKPSEWIRASPAALALGTVVDGRFIPNLNHAGWGDEA
jgi:hypothetical protein